MAEQDRTELDMGAEALQQEEQEDDDTNDDLEKELAQGPPTCGDDYPFSPEDPLPPPVGGYVYRIPKDELKKERAVVWEFVKNLGASLISKMSLVSISMPAVFFEPRSFLERIPDNWLHAPIYLKKACQAQDPVERLKLIMTFSISGLHTNVGYKKPFNPILGETYQATLNNEMKLFAEQISHHPPVSAWEAAGPADYPVQFSGKIQWGASFKGNYVSAKQTGSQQVQFPDGTLISWNHPDLTVTGIMFGSRILNYEGIMEFTDLKNRLSGRLVFGNADQKASTWSRLLGKASPPDALSGEITALSLDSEGSPTVRKGKDKVYCEITGSWLTGLDFIDVSSNGSSNLSSRRRYWDMRLPGWTPVKASENVLPSDCRFRQDLLALFTGDVTECQRRKEEMEESQREDARLRKRGYAERGITDPSSTYAT
eukprot:NODE_268_length_1713_cov_512.278245_g198_i0.p1 GENE.NODE_268_length_1713_cov_512.278245_g198_i0~~NODE_268_length_1713_cov_512.278245_g198_i0.p1  ORF type:complete len:428 (-),score=66.89 NODE_268_length_1713_cov_512.278245_g198_i0:345-1628(-)